MIYGEQTQFIVITYQHLPTKYYLRIMASTIFEGNAMRPADVPCAQLSASVFVSKNTPSNSHVRRFHCLLPCAHTHLVDIWSNGHHNQELIPQFENLYIEHKGITVIGLYYCYKLVQHSELSEMLCDNN